MEIDEGDFGKEEISMDVSPSSPFSDLGFFLFVLLGPRLGFLQTENK